ncbi:MAG TPA: hypothetical protein VK034_31335 [Enhygromyxa sp.]|nr:hypothetical protein [Enhygromyxa sp.]
MLAFASLLPACGGGSEEQVELCPAPVDGVPETYNVSFAGFPEIEDGALVDADGMLDFTGNCTITQLSFADGELSMVLACEHPDSTDAVVTLTVAATGAPAELAVDDTVELSSYAYYFQGGDRGGGVFRAISNVNLERHTITDDQGVVFAALRGGTEGSFGSITVEEQFNCPGWTPCSADGDISGYIRASSGDGSIDVQIGDIEQLDDGALAWDVSLFQALLGGCHGNDGGFSIVRRP